MISLSDIKEILKGGYSFWRERRPPKVRIFVGVPEVTEHPQPPRPADRYHVWGGSKGQNCIIFQVVHWKALTITGARLDDTKPLKWSPIHLSGQTRRPLEAEEPTHYQIRLDQVSAPENLTFVVVSNLKEWSYPVSKHTVRVSVDREHPFRNIVNTHFGIVNTENGIVNSRFGIVNT